MPTWELIFLNKHRYPKLQPTTAFRKDTKLLVPRRVDRDVVRRESEAAHPLFHEVTADMSFKTCAEGLHMDPRELLRVNQGRPELKGLQLSSELLEGTQILCSVCRDIAVT